MSTATDILSAVQERSSQRIGYERAWQAVRKLAAPEANDFVFGQFGSLGQTTSNFPFQIPSATQASKDIYDSTAIWCVDRLASGLEALIIPQSDYWHNFDIMSFTTEDPTIAAKQWLENLRNLTFKMRYDAESGWIIASQTALRRCIVFGNAFIEVEDGLDSRKAPIRYRYLPLNECFAAENRYGSIDTFYRVYALEARQAMQMFGGKCSEKVKQAANNPTQQTQRFTFVQCIRPRNDFGKLGTGGVDDSKFASFHIEWESKQIVRESGYFSFPIIDFRWMPEPGNVWAEGPVMRCLADVQSANVLAKNELIGSNQAVNPPLLMANAGVMNRPKNTPGHITMGGLAPNGAELVKPAFSGQRLDFATAVLEAKRAQIKESLYINLFATLVQDQGKNTYQSAAEAQIRANEKGELLGPAGARIQQSLSAMVDRELDIMNRRGAFAPGSAFAPPPELGKKHIGPHFTSPLDRYRKGREVEGTFQLLNTLTTLAQINPEVVDNFEDDTMTKGLAERLGVSAAFIRAPEKVAALRQQRQQQNAMQQNADAAQKYAAASQAGVGAFAQAQQAGLI